MGHPGHGDAREQAPLPAGQRPRDPVELRRGVLAVSVLDDLDLEPGPYGVVLPGSPRVEVPWEECRRALCGEDPESERGRTRLAHLLKARRWVASTPPYVLGDLLRPVGLPVDHLLHPGPDWVRHRPLGGSLDLGLGAVGLDPSDPDRVVLVPQPALDAVDLDGDLAWARAHHYLEDMGALAVQLFAGQPRGQLRPVGDCDVVTLLGSRRLRCALAAASGGMCAAVVPMRRRGWTRLALIDAAFGPAAAAATDPAERGFPRPVLLTADEVTVVADGGRPAPAVLAARADRRR